MIMRGVVQILLVLTIQFGWSQKLESPVDLSRWKLELPSGYKASDWKLSNFQKDRFAKPFFYLDSLDGALVMEAYPVDGKSKSKYTRNSLREQKDDGTDANWTMKEGAELVAEFQVQKMSKESGDKYHRTILFQVSGKTSAKQTAKLGLEKPTNIPYLKIFWQNERLKIVRRVLKNESTYGDVLYSKSSWEEESEYAKVDVGFKRTTIKIKLDKGRIDIRINDERPIIFRDASIRQWYFENYFTVGNYLQSKDNGAHAIVKYYQLEVLDKEPK